MTKKRLAIIRTRRTYVSYDVASQVLPAQRSHLLARMPKTLAIIRTRRTYIHYAVSPQVISTLHPSDIVCSVDNGGLVRLMETGGLVADNTHKPAYGPYLPFSVRTSPMLNLAVVKVSGRATAPFPCRVEYRNGKATVVEVLPTAKAKKGLGTSAESIKYARDDRDFTLGVKYLPHGTIVAHLDLAYGKRQGEGEKGTRHVINDGCLCLACLGGRIKMRLGRLDLADVAPTDEVKVKDFVCGCNGGLVRRSYSKLPCKVCGRSVMKADSVVEEYAEIAKVKMPSILGADAEKGTRQTKQRITCRQLFCANDTDLFSRSIAVNYLAKRMVYSPKSNATGKKEKGTVVYRPVVGQPQPTLVHERSKDGLGTLKSRKTSSNRHAMPMCMATDIEDIVNEAYLIHLTDGAHGGWTFRKTGNRLIDTVRACRMAHLQWQRAEFKRRSALEVVAYKADLEARGHTIGKTNERSALTVRLGKDFDSLLSAVEREGSAEQKDLAVALGVSQATVSRKLASLRNIVPSPINREGLRKSYKRS